jgi:hypothetical protein
VKGGGKEEWAGDHEWDLDLRARFEYITVALCAGQLEH